MNCRPNLGEGGRGEVAWFSTTSSSFPRQVAEVVDDLGFGFADGVGRARNDVWCARDIE